MDAIVLESPSKSDPFEKMCLLMPLIPIEKFARQHHVEFRWDMLLMNVYGEYIYNRLGANYTCEKKRRVGADFLLNLHLSRPAVLLAHAVLKVEHQIEPNELENK
ncbi:hypothetical protein GQ55_8G236800 [Panicum hallii var. hallii]|uniref:Uncharacterized protein n=1 Tax=Panicum hallii var. hallii TaxID=1504633 RepID=A0A2T7CQK3_9POAL|nr:hypothetical protein GQ55_8G236800 [Panicum hallii var. hallii]